MQSGKVAALDLAVSEGAYLIVRVDGADPLDVAQGLVRVDVRDSDDRQMGGLFSTQDFAELLSADRSFDEQRFGPLPPGTYRATATGPGGARVERTVNLTASEELRLALPLKD